MAVAQGVGPYHFTGTVWNPKALPATPAVGGHALATPKPPSHPKGYKALGHYQIAAPAWPAAGTTTVALTRTVTTGTAAGPPTASASASARAGLQPRAAAGTRGSGSPSTSGAAGASSAASPSAAAAATGSQVVPAAGPVKAGGLPVWVAPAASPGRGARVTGSAGVAAASGPAQVKVQVASHAQTVAAGGDGLLVGLTRADGQGTTGSVQVVLDYAALAKAFGGGFGSRLVLFQVPACALTTPQLAACRTRTPIQFSNRAGADQLTATVTLAPAATSSGGARSRTAGAAMPSMAMAPATAVMATSGTSGSQGNYAATSLNPSGTWQTSGTGAYTYAYPIDLPAAVGGNAPSVALSYDSQSVDGETSARNSQSSWLGDGWSYAPGFVEQSYRSCGSLLDSSGNRILKGSGDQCWAGDNATVSFGSHSGVLVPTATDTTVPGEVKAWKLQGDDGTVVQELSGAANGLQDGIYYRILTTDGSAAYFGSDHAPAGVGNLALAQSGTPSDASTNSAWGVPVLHPVAGDPCYDSSKGTASQCAKPQGWRWNLDFTVSPTGFVQRYDYATETNYYDLGGGQVAASNGSGTLTAYTRGGTLTQISYGYQLADELAGRTPAAQVVFASKQRCQTSSTFTDCSVGNLNQNTAPNWPDVPYDLNCPSTDSTTLPPGSTTVPPNVCITASPSFWTTTRLDSITTNVHVIDPVTKADKGLLPVDSYQLGQVFSDAGGTTDPVTGTTVDPKDAGSLQAVMWLQSIQHTGSDTYGNGNSPLTLNQVSFTGTEIDNRVNDVSPSAPPLYHPRISSIQTETGESISVNYNLNPCHGLSLSFAAADSNTHSCFPVYWAPPGASLPIQDWFNKTTVHSVVVADLTNAHQYTPNGKIAAGSETQVSTYAYGTPAWHRDDSALTDDQYRTWDQFRGYSTVTVQTGAAPEPVTQQTTTYLQGMDGDYKADGTKRAITISDSVGDQVTDSNWLAGTALETDSYTAAGSGTINAKSVSGPFQVTTTADTAQSPWTDWTQADNPGQTQPTLSTLPDLVAHRTQNLTTRSYALLAGGTTWRQTKTVTSYDTQGRVTTVDALGDVSDPTQEKCTTTSYAAPSGLNPMMLSYPDQVTTVHGGCAAPTSSTLLSDKQVYYDGDGTLTNLGTFGQLDQGSAFTPAAGQVSATRIATSYSGSTENWQTTAAMTYDGGGRVTKTLDTNGLATTTAFSPAWNTGGGNTNPTGMASTNPQGWTTSSTLDALRSVATENVDANGRVTDITYDALGRRTAVWLPGRSNSGGQSADETFAYSINPGAVPAPGGTITSPGAPSAVTTNTLRDDGTYATSISIYDGMLQPRQTQSTAVGDQNSGRLIADTFYDSHGWPLSTYATYSEPNNPPSTTLWAANETDIPSEQVTQYDGQGRSTASQLYHQAIEQWQSTTTYPGADETDATSPAGGTTTASFTNALGQTTATTVKNTASLVKLTGGQIIPSGTSLTSGSVRLAMQADGNLVLSSLATSKPVWSTSTSGNAGAWAQYGTDGNLAVYTTAGTRLWTSGLAAATGSVLQLQNDANLVIYNSSGAVAWASNTWHTASEADATTRYTYTPAGQVSTIKDTAGNQWSYQYNLLGQKTSQSDPNTGTTTFDQYDNLGNLQQTTDPRGQKLSYSYDWDNRVTATYAAAWSATPDPTTELSSAVFDTLAKGYPTSSTSYVGGATGKAYTQAVTGYNTAYQPTGTTLAVPTTDGFTQPALPTGLTAPTGQTLFATTPTYTPTIGLLYTTTYQNDGGLPGEQITYGYNQQGGLNGFGGLITPTNLPSYVDNTVHDPFGRVLQTNYGPSGKELATYDQYDATTGRVSQTSSMLQPSTTALDVTNYRYNQVGEITAIDDLQNNTTHDTQCFTYDSFQRLTQAWSDTAGITTPTVTPVGGVGGCNTSTPTTTATAPITTTTVGGPAAYWQTYNYDLLGDRTSMVKHDTSGNALNNTTQSTAYTGTDGTTASTLPNQAGASTVSNPTTGTATLTPSYTESNGKNAGNTTSRAATSTGPLSTNFTLAGGGKLCVDDATSSTTPGNKVQVYTCNGSGAQNWNIASDGTIRTLGVCLDTAGGATTAGTAVVINTCNTATATQKWKATSSGTLVNTGNTTLCLTDPAANATKGTQLTIATCGTTGGTWTTPATGNGATTPGQAQTLTYDARGRTATVTSPTSSNSQTSRYTYDASGNLLEQASSTNGTDTTRILYLFGGAEQITLNVASRSSTALRNYTGPDGTTITRTSSGTVTYQIANAQGTAETAVNASTLAVTHRYYDPYGNPRGASPSTWISADENHGFLGQPQDTTSGLNLLGARNYDPVQGRFLTPDPLFQAGDPNQMGGYTYAADNPASGSDPNGLQYNGGDGGGTVTTPVQDPTPTPVYHPDNTVLIGVGDVASQTLDSLTGNGKDHTWYIAWNSWSSNHLGSTDPGIQAGTDLGIGILAIVFSDGESAGVAADKGLSIAGRAIRAAKRLLTGDGEVVAADSSAATKAADSAANAAKTPPASDAASPTDANTAVSKPSSPGSGANIPSNDIDGTPIKTKSPGQVFRGDTRAPGDIAKAGGFEPKAGRHSLRDYVGTKGKSAGVVSTSSKISSAAAYTMPRGWIYDIRNPGVGIDINPTLSSGSWFKDRILGLGAPYPEEAEVAYPETISWSKVYRYKYYEGMVSAGDWTLNPDFGG
ncbi:ricin-type beta-trefoil lectin domain protein [Streptacidiphilus sp. MAP12-16]|uniref:ricin-type beta-trefoil lectin domain protein n=1 Tax=Streptacidiphilus sp. MAP12-16 TaxID=3156300 RepID=UPI003519D19B